MYLSFHVIQLLLLLGLFNIKIESESASLADTALEETLFDGQIYTASQKDVIEILSNPNNFNRLQSEAQKIIQKYLFGQGKRNIISNFSHNRAN